jgi:hypothetical protein
VRRITAPYQHFEDVALVEVARPKRRGMPQPAVPYMEDSRMRLVLSLALLAMALAGCKPREETGRAGQATDTVVTSTQTQDTTMVTHDTTVKVDTNVKKGEKATRVDTVKKTGPNAPARSDTSAKSDTSTAR